MFFFESAVQQNVFYFLIEKATSLKPEKKQRKNEVFTQRHWEPWILACLTPPMKNRFEKGKKTDYFCLICSRWKNIRNYNLHCATDRALKKEIKSEKNDQNQILEGTENFIFSMTFLKSKSGRVSDLGVINHIRKNSFVNYRKVDTSAINLIKCVNPRRTKLDISARRTVNMQGW